MPSQAQREDVLIERADFLKWLEGLDPRRVKAVDESGVVQTRIIDHSLMRLGYGYARRGQRLITHAPLRKGKRLSLLGRLGHDGSGAVAMHEASVRRSHFRGFIREHLLPHLKPGDVVLWDNARIHNRTIVRCAPEIGYLMRYPIWSKLKHWIRKAQAETSANGGRGVGGITRECFRCRGLVCALRIPPSMELTAAIPQHGPLPYPFSLTHKIRYVIATERVSRSDSQVGFLK